MKLVPNDYLIQGRLKIWTSHSHWFSLSLEPVEISLQKFQHSYTSKKYGFWQNLEGVAQKLNLPYPFEILDIFGWKSIFWAPSNLIFFFSYYKNYILGNYVANIKRNEDLSSFCLLTLDHGQTDMSQGLHDF